MLKKIIGTAGTRILNALFNLVILLLLTNKIGSEGLGTIGLILLDITIIQLVIDLVAGSAVIYFASRTNTGQLLIPAYTWIALVLILFYFIGKTIGFLFPEFYTNTIPPGHEMDILGLALLNGMMLTHYNFLIGKEKIRTYNIIFTIQITMLLITFLTILFIKNDQSINAYLTGLYFAYGTGSFLGFIALVRMTEAWEIEGWRRVFAKVVRFGIVTQIANILNIGNKRLSYYFVSFFKGLTPLGIFTAGIQLTEGLRLIGQSISLVQFSTISNTSEVEYARTLTIRLMKFSVILTLLAVFILVALPESTYTWLFSKDFSGVKPVIVALGPGVVALAANNIFSHYFSGLGNPKVNLWSNVVGMVFTISLAVLLIPVYGILGAAITTSASYISSVIYQYFVFVRQTGTRFSEWIPAKQDIADFKRIVKQTAKGKKDKGSDGFPGHFRDL